MLTSFLFFTLLYQTPISYSLQEIPSKWNEKCGNFHIPYPFHLNNSCASLVPIAFHVFCLNSTNLFLNIDSQKYKVLEFYSDGVLVDFPGAFPSKCRQYNDLNSFGFTGNDYFGLSGDNVIGLYDCEDSSLCKADCETIDLPGCDGNDSGSPGCCYQLSDHTTWKFGDGFSVFSKFGCRGFSSWVVSRGTTTGKRGVKLEWAIPLNSSKVVCASNAKIVNATSVRGGIRCLCQDGFVGDGFANGVGCTKSCIKNGEEAYGSDCYTRKGNQKTVIIIAGVLGPIFIVASLIALLCLVKRPIKAEAYYHDQRAHFPSTISFRKACRTRLFNYQELEEATKGFDSSQKLADVTHGTIYAGVLGDGSHVAVHKVQCEGEKDLSQVLSRIEVLSSVLHRNMARLLGCSIDSGYTPLVVYEYPANGTLEEHLHRNRGQNFGLDWNKRISIAVETASVFAFLQYEISVPIFHHDLRAGCILVDEEFSVRIAGFELLNPSRVEHESHLQKHRGGLHMSKSDVYDFGVLLLEMITGSKQIDLPTVALQKIKSGKLEEIVDPDLYYHEQPASRQEQIEIVADLATRCMLFGKDGKIGMIDVARELLHITKDSIHGGSRRGPALEETFSNSSLLQMISMSPDSIHVP
ncbi:hypothetical protein HS088_TW18G00704 [Tripterygium wilfordii]|uniref:Protein kinase domain-containing protein n=1 Tax=Tripterygium wilfordii TaxID=458696 RepID=A0A7J7CE70_TRIWF|nr:probably inactive receptor-like protein kinase At2g46850 [Tripterygium wilfordii]KAF5732016.1 hypothetical protein HS088_TW18G00704 [Tripterygium wilfordii]